MNIKQLLAIVGIVFVSICTACTSKEDELAGSWSTTFGSKNDYVQKRVLNTSENNPTYYHILTFNKGENGDKGAFTDCVSPLALGNQNNDDINVGSIIKGTWEVKKNKIYLYYNSEVSLTNADNLSDDDKFLVENEMARAFLADNKEAGENGVPYEIIKKNGKVALKIQLCNPSITLVKKKEKE